MATTAIPTEWLRVLAREGLDVALLHSQVDALYESGSPTPRFPIDIAPPRDTVFRAYELVKPANVRVVIIGLEPYPQVTTGPSVHTVADGLAFSSSVSSHPASLRSLFYNLWVHDHLAKPPPTADLKSWARQGVLLVNAALSVSVNLVGPARLRSRREHLKVYRPLIRCTLAALAGMGRRTLPVLLMGAEANGLAPTPAATGRLKVIRLSHPSRQPWPRPNNEQDPFGEVNKILAPRGIDWGAVTRGLPMGRP